jgi:phosphoribosylanthranilate isomerase
MYIKICGITNLNDGQKALSLGADAIGFIAYPKSKRYIDSKKVKEIVAQLSETYPSSDYVGVFVNAKKEEITPYINAGINIIQFHGNETNDEVNNINIECKKWKALAISTTEEIERINNFNVHRILIDAYDKENYGGTGKLANWELAKKAIKETKKKVILAGGITARNITQAIQKTNPYGLDLSSGVEKSPGIKDHKKLEELFKELKKNNYVQ